MIRKIKIEDNPFIYQIIITVMSEFKADPKTTVLGDPTIHDMYSTYQVENAVYFVLEENNKIIGGCGIRQLDGTTEKICELQRMFILPETRGKGYGKALMDHCLASAKKSGYHHIYLETLSGMHEALKLYAKSGFKKIDRPLGDTGHGGCNIFMIREIES